MIEQGLRSSSFRTVSILVPALTMLSACMAFLKFDDTQCVTDGDCQALSSASRLVCASGVCQIAQSAEVSDASSEAASPQDAGPWGCLGDPARPDIDAGPLPETLTLISVDGNSSLVPERGGAVPRTGVQVRLCPARDPTCATPLTEQITVEDPDGVVTVPTPLVDFYVETTGSDITPILTFPPSRITSPSRWLRPIYLSSLYRIQTTALAGAINAKVNKDLGIVLARPFSCTRAPDDVLGITIDMAPIGTETVGFYTVGGFPSATATATSVDGLGGFVNAPVGVVTISTYFSDRTFIGRGAAFSRAGWMTVVEVAPTGR